MERLTQAGEETCHERWWHSHGDKSTSSLTPKFAARCCCRCFSHRHCCCCCSCVPQRRERAKDSLRSLCPPLSLSLSSSLFHFVCGWWDFNHVEGKRRKRCGKLALLSCVHSKRGLSQLEFVFLLVYLSLWVPLGDSRSLSPSISAQTVSSVEMRSGSVECQHYRNDNDRAMATGLSQWVLWSHLYQGRRNLLPDSCWFYIFNWTVWCVGLWKSPLVLTAFKCVSSFQLYLKKTLNIVIYSQRLAPEICVCL